MSGQTPAGWYADPYGTSDLRYWDGSQWTDATRPADDISPFAPPAPSLHKGGTTPPPWAPPAPAPAKEPNNAALMALLIGGGAVAAVLIVLVALFAVGVLGGDDSGTTAADPAPTASAPLAPTPSTPSATSPVTGTITDREAGVSYAQLGGVWRAAPIPRRSVSHQVYGMRQGQTAVVQENYDGRGGSYVSSVYSGSLPDQVPYKDSEDLATATNLFARTVTSAAGPHASYPSPHGTQELQTEPRTFDGHDGYLVKLKLTFPQAQSQGWNFTSETVIVVLIDRGEDKRPAVLWMSMPDSHPHSGDLDQVLGSIKVL
ncbi:DUF2510 domain-containing protein [Thermomonospora catenispora]|uniref:DUF2510 domain-containing protein n=1 Tax=Thermomonospora catenispora TaxID=2493090 RepID=UPI001375E242|nr:DUF2510 domain-containing protein [Thermomonospora catenispora]